MPISLRNPHSGLKALDRVAGFVEYEEALERAGRDLEGPLIGLASDSKPVALHSRLPYEAKSSALGQSTSPTFWNDYI